jgi:FKBP-type peptidyl-prolyl cis-trans isomerase 2
MEDKKMAQATQAKDGDTVKVNYTGTLDDGTVFDTSFNREPLEFTIGEGQLIPAFEEAAVGMTPGERKTVHIPSNEAYGPRHEELVAKVDRTEFPEGLDPEIGNMLKMQRPDGQTLVVTVTDISDEDVTLDANHPLAGKDLNFDIEMVEVGR